MSLPTTWSWVMGLRSPSAPFYRGGNFPYRLGEVWGSRTPDGGDPNTQPTRHSRSSHRGKPGWSVPCPPNQAEGPHSHSRFTQLCSQQTPTEHPLCIPGPVPGAGGGKVNKAAGTQIPNQLQPYLLLSVNVKNQLWQGNTLSASPVPGAALSIISFNPLSSLLREAQSCLFYR